MCNLLAKCALFQGSENYRYTYLVTVDYASIIKSTLSSCALTYALACYKDCTTKASVFYCSKYIHMYL